MSSIQNIDIPDKSYVILQLFKIIRNTLFYLLILFSVPIFAQNGITFKVEKLSKSERLLDLYSPDEIYESLILSGMSIELYEMKRKNIKVPYHIIVKSESPGNLVSFGPNSFFNGIYRAYTDHRPFVLSPDMIWLLISQEFTCHINANQESMRNDFVDFSGRLSLIMREDKELEDPAPSWEKVFPRSTKRVFQYADSHLTRLLTCNFSTITSLKRVASEITIMEAVKPHFEFIIIRIVCGMPKIILEGTPGDWEKLLHKARGLKEYKLDWQISELESLLEEFVKASKGEVSKGFWHDMFKYHSRKKCGTPNIIDGQIAKLFPYDEEGERNNLQQLEGRNCLPDEIVKIDVEYQEVCADGTKETPLEFWAGFIGLKQNSKTFALRSQIGWMIRRKGVNEDGLRSRLSADAQEDSWGNSINIRVKEFPAVLSELKEIRRLDIQFIDTTDIPNEISKIKIGSLSLCGKITKEGIERIKRLLPGINIKINSSREVIKLH